MTVLRLTPAKAAGLRVDALVVGVGRDPKRANNVNVPAECGLSIVARRQIVESLTRVGGTGDIGETVKLPGVEGIHAPLVVTIGLGVLADQISHETLRRAAGSAIRALAGIDKVALALPVSGAAEIAAVAQGALLGSYLFEDFRGVGTAKPRIAVKTITVVAADGRDSPVRDAVRQAEIIAHEVRRARDLVNTPPSALHPKELAEAALAAVTDLPVTTQVLDEAALKRGKYGGIIAVGQGSAHPPRLVRLAYRPARHKLHIAFVGKGITFDSGGLSLKSAKGMETMKCDMAGAAVVIAATAAIARLGLPVWVTTYAACAENMPSGTAQRPGDVLTMYGGRTVEVLNTDAEGRLVMADALVRASEDKPDVIVDVATLTNGQIVALGTRVSAVMSNDAQLRDGVVAAATSCGEQFWPMPLPEALRPSLDSPIADLANIGERMGGMLTAGLFLQEFVPEQIRWAHLDIAGPAFNEGEPHGYTPRGATGVAVRTLVQLARDLRTTRVVH